MMIILTTLVMEKIIKLMMMVVEIMNTMNMMIISIAKGTTDPGVDCFDH